MVARSSWWIARRLVGPLMESELFGYSRGAFTGANNPKLGLLDAANGGTAFFDEIGELPLDLQMKLLRVLQEKEFRAVGALTQRSSDFRVIAATNRNLLDEIAKNRFRQDLYYRLAVMEFGCRRFGSGPAIFQYSFRTSSKSTVADIGCRKR